MSIQIRPGQSVKLTAQPLFNGVVGGAFLEDVVWSHNLLEADGSVGLSDTVGETTTLSLTSANVAGKFLITATAGTLTTSVEIVITAASSGNGIQIVADPVK